jgi:hypothetical protein
MTQETGDFHPALFFSDMETKMHKASIILLPLLELGPGQQKSIIGQKAAAVGAISEY